MQKAAFLASLFFAGCAANSLLSWLAAINPAGFHIARFVYIAMLIICTTGIFFDDGIRPITGLNPAAYYTAIAMIFLSAVLGGGLIWLSP